MPDLMCALQISDIQNLIKYWIPYRASLARNDRKGDGDTVSSPDLMIKKDKGKSQL